MFSAMFTEAAFANFWIALQIMGLGMLSIFIVMIVLILIVGGLARFNIGGKKKKDE